MAQLAALWAYSVSQPVFTLLQGNPEFLVVRGATRLEVIVFALVIALVPPTAITFLEWGLARISVDVAAALHLCVIAALGVPIGLQIVSAVDPDFYGAAFGALAIAFAAFAAYWLWRPVGVFLAFAAVLPAVGLATFLIGVPLATDDAAGADVEVTRTPPIVFLVLDEFPVSSLMTRSGQIDTMRYPNFARLARSSTWYPRATTVHEHTTGAVPAILTGRLPRPAELPVLADHPENLFTLLGETYGMYVHEAVTHLCPKRYCPRESEPLSERLMALLGDVEVAYLHRILPESMTKGLPAIGDRWGRFRDPDLLLAARDTLDVDRVVAKPADPAQPDYEDFLDELSRNAASTLSFFHLLLPHSPWRYLPSGRHYGQAAEIDGITDAWNRWVANEWLVAQGYQRHLLQVGYTDRQLGKLLDVLVRTRTYESSLVVVAADHGISFTPGGTRRTIDEANVADIARVPLFIKLPGQTYGRVDRRAARLVDVLPTIAEALGVEIPDLDGRSLLQPGASPGVVDVMRRDGSSVRVSTTDVDRAQNSTVKRKSALFGEGADDLYGIGRNVQLLGRSIRRAGAVTTTSAEVQFDSASVLENIDRSSPLVPSRLTGTVEGTLPSGTRELAVVVNGRIAALTRPFRLDGRQRFGAMVPETTFRDGRNEVELYAIVRDAEELRLVRLSDVEGNEYQLTADGGLAGPGELHIDVVPNRVAGKVETRVDAAGSIRLRGWAADLEHLALVDRIVVFVDDRFVYSGPTSVYRWELPETQGKQGLERSGWEVDVPNAKEPDVRIRVFALRGRIASELGIPNGRSAVG